MEMETNSSAHPYWVPTTSSNSGRSPVPAPTRLAPLRPDRDTGNWGGKGNLETLVISVAIGAVLLLLVVVVVLMACRHYECGLFKRRVIYVRRHAAPPADAVSMARMGAGVGGSRGPVMLQMTPHGPVAVPVGGGAGQRYADYYHPPQMGGVGPYAETGTPHHENVNGGGPHSHHQYPTSGHGSAYGYSGPHPHAYGGGHPLANAHPSKPIPKGVVLVGDHHADKKAPPPLPSAEVDGVDADAEAEGDLYAAPCAPEYARGVAFGERRQQQQYADRSFAGAPSAAEVDWAAAGSEPHHSPHRFEEEEDAAYGSGDERVTCRGGGGRWWPFWRSSTAAVQAAGAPEVGATCVRAVDAPNNSISSSSGGNAPRHGSGGSFTYGDATGNYAVDSASALQPSAAAARGGGNSFPPASTTGAATGWGATVAAFLSGVAGASPPAQQHQQQQQPTGAGSHPMGFPASVEMGAVVPRPRSTPYPEPGSDEPYQHCSALPPLPQGSRGGAQKHCDPSAAGEGFRGFGFSSASGGSGPSSHFSTSRSSSVPAALQAAVGVGAGHPAMPSAHAKNDSDSGIGSGSDDERRSRPSEGGSDEGEEDAEWAEPQQPVRSDPPSAERRTKGAAGDQQQQQQRSVAAVPIARIVQTIGRHRRGTAEGGSGSNSDTAAGAAACRSHSNSGTWHSSDEVRSVGSDEADLYHKGNVLPGPAGGGGLGLGLGLGGIGLAPHAVCNRTFAGVTGEGPLPSLIHAGGGAGPLRSDADRDSAYGAGTSSGSAVSLYGPRCEEGVVAGPHVAIPIPHGSAPSALTAATSCAVVAGLRPGAFAAPLPQGGLTAIHGMAAPPMAHSHVAHPHFGTAGALAAAGHPSALAANAAFANAHSHSGGGPATDRVLSWALEQSRRGGASL